MKSFVLLLVFAGILHCATIDAQKSQMHNEIESTIKAFTESVIDKDIDKLMSYWLDHEDFMYTADGKIFTYEDLHKAMDEFCANTEKVIITNQTIKVTPLANKKALCTWQGSENLKMKEKEAVDINWISTFVMENKKGGWVILHGHTSHY